jgi:hypothetical protein
MSILALDDDGLTMWRRCTELMTIHVASRCCVGTTRSQLRRERLHVLQATFDELAKLCHGQAWREAVGGILETRRKQGFDDQKLAMQCR